MCFAAAATERWRATDDGGAGARAEIRVRHARTVLGNADGVFYRIPDQAKAVRQKSTDGALVYVGLDLPGVSGSLLVDAFTKQSRATNGRDEVLRLGLAVKSASGSNDCFPHRLGLTPSTFEETFERFTTREPKEYYGPERLRKLYDNGARVYFSGELGMGLCDRVDAPCSYTAVLRNPVEQFVNQYASDCLAGSNNRAAWSAEMKAKGFCGMGLNEWFDWYQEPESGLLNFIAPGVSANKDAQFAAAIHNLDKECFRFLLAEKIDDGLDRMSMDPDFSEIATSKMKKAAEKALSSRPTLGEREMKLLDSQTSDAGVMTKLKERLRHERALYDHAVHTYEHKWKSRWFSC